MKNKEIKLLWGKSGGRCSFEGCKAELSQEDTVLGEQAHIIARSQEGPRGQNKMDSSTRDDYANLILLCSDHHTLVDKQPEIYTVEKLKEMKVNHEKWVSERLKIGTPWNVDLAQIHYLNIPRLSILFALKGYSLSPELDIDISGPLHDLGGMPLIKIMHHFALAINDLRPNSLELKETERINHEHIGAVISFDENFRTKGYRNYGGSISGNLEKDPHVYKKSGELKWIFPIDPKWITTSTAQAEFCNGRTRLAGLAMIKSLQGNTIVCTPLVLGLRKSDWGF